MPLTIGYGILAGRRPPASDQPWTAVYDDILSLICAAEEAGFDSAWTTEHHFTDDGYLSAQLPLLAAAAVRTERIGLGTNVLLAPLHHPLRVAEDAAAVDVLSGGRLRLGMALGYRDPEFEAFGVPKRERVGRLEDCVEVCRRAWGGEPFTYRGNHVDLRDLVVRPTPPGPPQIWLGGWGDRSLERAGRLADGYLSPLGDLDDTLRRLETVDGAAARAGRAGTVDVATINLVSVSPDGRMPPGVLAGLEHMNETYTEWYGSSSDDVGGRAVARLIQDSQELVAGTPDEVAGRLSPLARRLSGDRECVLIAWLHYPGMPRREAETHLELFATEVMPRLRDAAA